MKIYKITNTINNLIYIGQTKHSLKRRFSAHCRKSSTCTYLKNAIQKYGRSNFIIELVEEVESPALWDIKEKEYIHKYNSLVPNGYNILIGGAGSYSEIKGYTHTKKSQFKGKNHTSESKDLMRQAKVGVIPWNKGKTNIYSEETKLKFSAAKKGKPSPRLGVKLSEETRQKISLAKKGKSTGRKGIPLSEETKKKLSIANSGKPGNRLGVILSEEVRKKMSLAKLGKLHSRRVI